MRPSLQPLTFARGEEPRHELVVPKTADDLAARLRDVIRRLEREAWRLPVHAVSERTEVRGTGAPAFNVEMMIIRAMRSALDEASR